MILGTILLCLAGAFADTPVESLPDPLRVRFEEAEAAWSEGDLEGAEDAFSEVIAAQPEFDRAWRRRCGVVLALGRVTEALTDCRRAVELSDGYENRTGLAIALLQTDEGLLEAGPMIEAVLAEHDDYLPAWAALCSWAAEAESTSALSRCAQHLDTLAPGTPGTLYYQALALAFAGDVEAAGETIRLAREKGLPDDLGEVATRAIARHARDEQQGGRKARAEQRSQWSITDLIPLLIAGALALTVGVLAFGDDEDEDEPQGPPPQG